MAIPIIILIWTQMTVPAAFRAIVSGAFLLIFLIAAPVWCAAENRDGTACRNNATGLFSGCHLRQHRWQKVVALQHSDTARALVVRLRGNYQSGAAAAGTVVASISGAVAAISALLN